MLPPLRPVGCAEAQQEGAWWAAATRQCCAVGGGGRSRRCRLHGCHAALSLQRLCLPLLGCPAALNRSQTLGLRLLYCASVIRCTRGRGLEAAYKIRYAGAITCFRSKQEHCPGQVCAVKQYIQASVLVCFIVLSESVALVWLRNVRGICSCPIDFIQAAAPMGPELAKRSVCGGRGALMLIQCACLQSPRSVQALFWTAQPKFCPGLEPFAALPLFVCSFKVEMNFVCCL